MKENAGVPNDIAQFVAKKQANKAHPNCWTCALPESDDLNAAYREGIGVALLCAYLAEEKNYGPADSLEGRVRGHFRRGHHLDGVEAS